MMMKERQQPSRYNAGRRTSPLLLLLQLVVLAIIMSCSSCHAFSLAIPATTAIVQSIADFYENQPGEAAMVTCAVKACSADLVAQVRQQKHLVGGKQQQQQHEHDDDDDSRSSYDSSTTRMMNNKEHTTSATAVLDFDSSRTLSFLLYGAFYQGLAQHFIYNHLFTEWFGDGRDPLIVATKVLCDMALVSPYLPLPLSYSIKSLVSGQSIQDGLEHYVDGVIHQNLLFKYWAFWMPVQIVNFSFVPEAYRILFMAAFSFVWTIILSSTMNTSSSSTTTTLLNNNDDDDGAHSIKQQDMTTKTATPPTIISIQESTL